MGSDRILSGPFHRVSSCTTVAVDPLPPSFVEEEAPPVFRSTSFLSPSLRVSHDMRVVRAKRCTAPKTFGLMDISKHGGKMFLDGIASLISSHFPDAIVHRYTKASFTRPASTSLRERIAAACDHVILALAD